VIGQVRATDADAGDNARLTYSVTRVNGRDERGPLSVDPRSGDVVVVGRLDYERRADYVLTVAATDHAAPPPLRHVGFTRVVVRLLDQVMTGICFRIFSRDLLFDNFFVYLLYRTSGTHE